VPCIAVVVLDDEPSAIVFDLERAGSPFALAAGSLEIDVVTPNLRFRQA
jgi:hypothetical protein